MIQEEGFSIIKPLHVLLVSQPAGVEVQVWLRNVVQVVGLLLLPGLAQAAHMGIDHLLAVHQYSAASQLTLRYAVKHVVL